MNKNNLFCLITGATSGIGKAIATALAYRGHHVILLSKDENQLKSVREDISRQTGNLQVEYHMVDLSLQQEIRSFAGLFNSKYPVLDVLINNAAVNLPRKTITGEGIEYVFAVNHLAPFLLTDLLLDKLKSAGNGQIINIASNGEKYATFDAGNLQAEKGYNAMNHYCLTKLCNLMFSYELARRLENTGVTSNAIHPGGVRTNIMKSYNLFSLPAIVWKILYPKLKTPETVALHLMNLFNKGVFKNVNGKYFFKEKMVLSSPASRNCDYSRLLWKVSEDLIQSRTSG